MNSVVIEPTENSVLIELVDVFTVYFYLQAAQTAPEHRVVVT